MNGVLNVFVLLLCLKFIPKVNRACLCIVDNGKLKLGTSKYAVYSAIISFIVNCEMFMVFVDGRD